MDFHTEFNLVRSQKLLLIPQLKLALDVLEMDSGELSCYIESQLDINPALEPDMDARPSREPSEEEDEGQLQEDPENTLTLKQHLFIQFYTTHLDKSSLLIGEYLIDNTDDNGYLKVGIPEVADFFGVPCCRVEAVLRILQSFDPPGICARNLRECLLLQLRQQEEPDEDAVMVVERYIDRIASGDSAFVADETGFTQERVREIFNRVKGLEPRPGREFYNDAAKNPISPDVIIRETPEGFRAIYNEDAFPDVCLSDSFQAEAAGLAEKEGEQRVHEEVKGAVWLIKCLEQRKDIILEVAGTLLEQEGDFFAKGAEHIRKLARSSFAATLNMHETILEKAIAGKTLLCRWGSFPFRCFFTDG